MIGVAGLGFVGLTTGLGFSDRGYKVVGFDLDVDRRQSVAKGEVPFHEPMLGEKLNEFLGRGAFSLGEALEDHIADLEVLFFCVGTPSGGDGSVDLTILKRAVSDALALVDPAKRMCFVIKSTIPPGSTVREIVPLIEAERKARSVQVGLAVNPEFLREGYAWQDFINPDRIVVGCVDEWVVELMEKLYSGFDCPVSTVSFSTAEFAKYLSNTLLANLISFSNDMAALAESIGDIDVPGAFRLTHKDRRWSGSPAGMASYFFPGIGFGGYCLPKDTSAVLEQGKAYGYSSAFLAAILSKNREAMESAARKIMNSSSPGDTIGILGLAFKPESDDVRETPSRAIIEILLQNGYTNILAHDPVANENFRKSFNLPITYTGNSDELLKESSVVAILTGWNQFRELAKNSSEKEKLLDLRYLAS